MPLRFFLRLDCLDKIHVIGAVFFIQRGDSLLEFFLLFRFQEDDFAAGINDRGTGEDVVTDPEVSLIQGGFFGAFQNDLAVFFRQEVRLQS